MWKGLEKLYKMNYLFVESEQVLQEISSFEKLGRFLVVSTTFTMHVLIGRIKRYILYI